MRTSLILFGVIFLVVGVFLYLVPVQEVRADTTNVGNGNIDSNTSYARVTVPSGWAHASAIIGVILLIFGMAISSPVIVRQAARESKKDSYEKVVESKENVEFDDGRKHKTIREHTEMHKTIKDGSSE